MKHTKKDKEIAVVVGATGAFGKAIVARLIGNGLTVVAVSRTEESMAMLRAEYPEIMPCIADIANDSAIEHIKSCVQGSVRMVVHGPGVTVAGGVLTASTSAVIEAVNIKVGGLLRLVRAVDGFLVTGSRLVSIGGHYGLEPTAYAASAGIANAALINVSRQLSLAYGEKGITAHVIAPGPADTERLRRVASDRANINNTTTDDVLNSMRAESSTGRFTTPEQVAWAVSMLLDSEADAMTGSALMLDSGRRRGLP
ncbi:SDR family NAD(P)-dependent oxidoreductase [Paraglaciecola chathamensis]|uniref:SDR-family protein n=1 Tax=Paraglaciecola agarilytica NO2 TaxID=1125747 RepID=A0ABQ0IA88_9ALTE|nr:SDR family oxidoreductase [Paraglaciecola agarilytica]GAC06221.1 SDR-family protein [Paraglaciecola agarilytica NO2]